VDGQPIGPAFARNIGLCLQSDIHDDTSTVREAFEFSALLRQDSTIPRVEKLEYVDKVVDILGLQELQDVVIGSLGLEQKRRTTLGVELCAKPKLLLFLDEPTSVCAPSSTEAVISD
jgi:ATP-binding cassette, subfamily G (WHITE), member 2, SNQ2